MSAVHGWRVLIARTPEQSVHLRDLLTAQGAQPVTVPTIQIEPSDDPRLVDAIDRLVNHHYSWVLFTSANAVEAVRRQVPQLPEKLAQSTRIAAVGAATAAAITDWGLPVDLVPAGRQNSAGLAAEFAAVDSDTRPVLLPRSDLADEVLPTALNRRGWTVDEVIAYRTVAAPPPPPEVVTALSGGDIDAVVFSSSSTVTGLLDLVGRPHPSTVIASIGPRTSQTCRERGLRVDCEAAQPSVAELVSALLAYAGEHPQPLGRVGES